MHLINVLASGVVGAAGGYAEIYRQATSTRDWYFTDFDGQVAVFTGASVTLDANGGATVYVNSFVDVHVYSSSGVLVREFTAGDEATAVNYSGASALGVNPVTAQSAPYQPVSVKAVLDRLITSFGATDFQVLFGGSASNLVDVLAGLNTFFNVKNPLYGATGNLVSDDTSAIQAALDAAGAIGGIVWFPAGQYKISATLNVPAKVSLLGAGPFASIISQSSGSAQSISFRAGADANRRTPFMRGLSFTASVSNNVTVVVVREADLLIEQCQIGDGANVAGFHIDGAGLNTLGGKLVVRDCEFNLAADTKAMAYENAGGPITVDHCKFILSGTRPMNPVLDLNNARVSNCTFYNDTVTSGTYSCIRARDCDVAICNFRDSGGATVTAIEYSSGLLYETSNVFAASITAYSGLGSDAALGNVLLMTREQRWDEVIDDAVGQTISAEQFGSVYHRTNGTSGGRTYTFKPGPVGARFVLRVYNHTGANWTVTVRTAINGGGFYVLCTDASAAASTTVNDTETYVASFISTHIDADQVAWVQAAQVLVTDKGTGP
jgi:hypothetical protein